MKTQIKPLPLAKIAHSDYDYNRTYDAYHDKRYYTLDYVDASYIVQIGNKVPFDGELKLDTPKSDILFDEYVYHRNNRRGY